MQNRRNILLRNKENIQPSYNGSVVLTKKVISKPIDTTLGIKKAFPSKHNP